MNNHQHFFAAEVPALLAGLNEDSQRLWGSMSAIQMVDHLLAGTKLFQAGRAMQLTVPEERLPKLKAFLMSDKNFMEGAQKPELYQEYESVPGKPLQQLKEEFLEELQRFDKRTQTDPDFWCFHASFGRLNAEETRQLQYKHIRHHFQQFGLLPRE